MTRITPYLIAVYLVTCGVSAAFDTNPKFESKRFWADKITENYAEGIVGQIPDLINGQTTNMTKVPQPSTDPYISKLRVKFFNLVNQKKFAQAQAVSKMLVRKGDYTGEHYLAKLN